MLTRRQSCTVLYTLACYDVLYIRSEMSDSEDEDSFIKLRAALAYFTVQDSEYEYCDAARTIGNVTPDTVYIIHHCIYHTVLYYSCGCFLFVAKNSVFQIVLQCAV